VPFDPKPLIADIPGVFVAREHELSLLTGYRRKAAGGHGCIVLIAGDAGVGKSSLLRRFEADTDGGRAVSAFARCVEFIQTPLSTLRELLQNLEHNRSLPRDTGTRALLERLSFERGAEVSAGVQPASWLLESVDAAFARRAQRGTIVLLIEDVHWADRSMLGFLNYLADRIANRRMLVVATYRREEVDARHALVGDFATLLAKVSVSQITLGPLDERATQALIEMKLPHPGALDVATIADMVRRCQGNPFFAEELLKSVLERSPNESPRQLPLSIRGAVLARAALLSESERKILSLAAVLGRRFSIDRLVTLCGGRRDDVLLALERAQLLYLVVEAHGTHGELAFRHALTQEVLYGELLAERVRPLHQAIGLELERSADRNAVSVELAHHWWRAGDAKRAATYAELAGDRAFAIGAMADAISYFERALAQRSGAGTDVAGTDVAGLEHKIGIALGSLFHLSAGIERLRRAGDLYWQAGDLEGYVKNVSALEAQMYNAGDARGAIDLCRRTIDALRSDLPTATLDVLRARIAYDCVAGLDIESALDLVNEIAEPIANPMTATHAYQAQFKVAAMRGDLDRWRTYAQRALDAAGKVGDVGNRLCQTHCQIALDAVGLGEVQPAREHFHAAISLARKGDLAVGLLAYAASAYEHTLHGDFATAARFLALPGIASEHSYAILMHVKSAQFVLGICAGDDDRLRSNDAESLLQYVVEHGMKLAIGVLGGPYAWALGLRGEVDDAAAWIHRIAKVVPGPHRFLFAFLAAAQFGTRSDAADMRRMLFDAASRPQDRVNKAVLHLFDAFAAQRGFADGNAEASALTAASSFEAIGWPWLAAQSYELGGARQRALETYRTIGAIRDLRRMEVGQSDATVAVLSPREREVGRLVALGHSNDEVAQILHISPRTVEKHVSAALDKLNLRSRLQLGRLLGREA
jgi:DNA-binding CsgD family transcriptional regulator/tetratricopeptide (TPR) repeat protein